VVKKPEEWQAGCFHKTKRAKEKKQRVQFHENGVNKGKEFFKKLYPKQA